MINPLMNTTKYLPEYQKNMLLNIPKIDNSSCVLYVGVSETKA